MSITGIVLTKNSEATIEKALKSLGLICNELIVIDDFSTDKTVLLAKKLKAEVFKRHLNNNFSDQRNFALEKASNKWVFFLDSDEYLSEKLISCVKSANLVKFDGFKIRRQDIFFDKKLVGGEWGTQKILRIGKKNSGKFKGNVHEVWKISSNATGELNGEILHENINNLNIFIKKLNFYSQNHAFSKKKVTFFDILIKPVCKFLLNFLIKKGFKDGTHGFVYAVFMSFHSFLAWSTAWLNTKNK